MWFRKVFIWVLLVCGLFSHSLIAEDDINTNDIDEKNKELYQGFSAEIGAL